MRYKEKKVAMTTVVLGASPDPERYAHKAVVSLSEKGFETIPVGKRPGTINGIPIQKDLPEAVPIDTISLYLNSENQQAYYQRILDLHPRRVVFNPGAENPEFKAKLEDQGIEVEEACTLVMLSRGVFA